MKRYLILVIVALVVFTNGCKTGAATRHYYKATGPIAELQLKKGTDTGMLSRRSNYLWPHELLAFDDNGLLILANEKLVLVEYDALIRYKHRGKRAMFAKKDNAGAIRSEITNLHNGGMAFLVRYPQGVSQTLLEGLLEAYGQAEIIKISSKK